MARLIPLTGGKVVIVDDKDFDLVSQLSWYAHVNKSGNWCAESKGAVRVIMHRLIMAAPKGWDVDHRDRDGLNNRRYNLRVCTRSQNLQNRRKSDGKSVQYKGVYRAVWSSGTIKYQAYITKNYKRLHLGTFASPIEAAKAYDENARKLFGEFARTNFGPVSCLVP